MFPVAALLRILEARKKAVDAQVNRSRKPSKMDMAKLARAGSVEKTTTASGTERRPSETDLQTIALLEKMAQRRA